MIEDAVQPSPARVEAPEPQAWLPLSELAGLPALEELLKSENLVESGQTLAIRMRARDPQPFEEPPHVERSRVAAPAPARRAPDLVPAPRPTRESVVAARRAARAQRRLRVLLVTAVLVAILVIVPLLFVLAPEPTVSLVIDGETRTVTATGNTVADVVRSAGVWLGPHDRVSPALTEPLPGGTPIQVHRARPVVVDVDGSVRTEWVIADSVADLVDELRIDENLVAITEGDIDFAAPVVFRTRHRAVIVADGVETPVRSTALTVGEILGEAGVDLGPVDEVTPGVHERVTPDARIEVVRITGEEWVEDRVVARATERRNDASLPKGQTRVLQPGVDGLERVTVFQQRRDGAPADARVVNREVVKVAQPKVIAVGTGSSAASAGGTGSTAGTPAPVAPAARANRETGQATWYDHIPGTCAHKTIPKGTVVTVTNVANGKTATCVVADRGPFAAGRIIDLTPGVFEQLAPKSSGVISVRIEW